MNGELAALIALTFHGGAWLRNPNGEPPALETENSSYKYVDTLQFTQSSRRWRRRPIAQGGSASWLRDQAKSGVEDLRLAPERSTAVSDLPPAVATAFANGMPRGIVSVGDVPALWLSTWDVTDQGRADNRIWGVSMTKADLPGAVPPAFGTDSLDGAKTHLASALGDIHGFAVRNDLSSWAEWFVKAQSELASPTPVVPYNADIAPPGTLTLAQHQLIAGGFQSWVFGGMGSWNDLWLEDESLGDELRRVTDNLYAAVMTALLVASNFRNI